MAAMPGLRAAIIVFDGVEELDFVGPWEVFTMAGQVGADLGAVTVGWPNRNIRCAKGLRIIADYEMPATPFADIVLVPGGMGARALAEDADFLGHLQRLMAPARWQTSVCTGSALLGRAGFLDGKRATTHHNAFPFLLASAPKAIPVRGERYVVDGQVVTAAGVSAGIDMALWLVGEIFGPEMARKTQTAMEYFPNPPYDTPPPAGTRS